MLGIVLKILSIVGIVFLVLLLLAVLAGLLVLFFPFTYRVSGCRDEKGLRLQVKVNWLFGLFRVRYRYPEPGRLTAKALWFSLIDLKIPPDKSEKKAGEKKDGRAGESGTAPREKEASAGEPAGGKSVPTGSASPADSESGPRKDESAALENPGQESSGAVSCGNAGKSGSKAEVHSNAEVRDDAGQRQDGAAALESPDRGIGKNEPQSDASGSIPGVTAPEDGNEGIFGKISQKLQKIKYTIYSIYDKIKKIWENISYYIELLQEENTKQLAAHAMKRARKIMKSCWPSRIRARVLFGTGSPDTTGYLYGAYCMASALYGGELAVTPDFEQKIFEGEFDIAGHVVVWVFVVNGAMLLLDRKLRLFLKRLKRGQKLRRKA